MGVDCVALIGKRERPPDIERVLRELDALNPMIAGWWPSALPGYRTRYNPDVDQAWRVVDEWSDDDVHWLAGSRDLLLQVCRRAVIHPAEPRWQTFLTAVESRRFARRVCSALASVFGGDRVIYVPDETYRESDAATMIRTGASVEEVQDWLLRTCGPSALEWDQHAAAADGAAYLVDRLGDR